MWVHDFHLMLVPAMLRRRSPGLSIGFFLHIPFPSSEVYRLLPAREQLLRGVLGADYISFQVGDYARHFRSSCLRMLGLDSSPDWLELDDRRIGIGVDPIGIDVEGFRELLADPETERLLAGLEQQYEGRKLVLGVERLDYTKGIPQKLHAFERFLEEDPERALTTTMIQVLVPSRLESPEYVAQRNEIELLISRINGRFGQPGITPVEYLHRDVSKPGLVALYRRADVMMVTALRDGMNLVAQEFVLCQSRAGPPEPLARVAPPLRARRIGAGASRRAPRQPLGRGRGRRAPRDRARAARARAPAPARDDGEARRGARLPALGRGLPRAAREVLTARSTRRGRPPTVDEAVEERISRRFARARARTIILDYDGTLRELEAHPDLASPTPEIRGAPPRAGGNPANRRPHRQRPPPAEPRAVVRPAPDPSLRRARLHGAGTGRGVATLVDLDLSWLRPIERLLRKVAADVPGSHVERKSCSVAWHYRQAEREYGAWRAHELLNDLGQHLAGAPAEILLGHQLVEVRARGVDKGVYVKSLFPDGKESSHFVIGLGDDRTDHDLLDALPSGSVAGHVGGLLPSARSADGPREHIHVVGPGEVRAFLHDLAMAYEARHGGDGDGRAASARTKPAAAGD